MGLTADVVRARIAAGATLVHVFGVYADGGPERINCILKKLASSFKTSQSGTHSSAMRGLNTTWPAR